MNLLLRQLLIIFAYCAPSFASLTVNCEFSTILSTYSCTPVSANYTESEENAKIEVIGTHIEHFKDEDVSYIRFNSPLTFHTVPTQLFEIFPNIEIFGLQSVKLSNITSNAFLNCYKLKKLFVDGNNELTELPASFAEECGSLESLYLPGNGIEVIDKDAFNGLFNLEYLTLARNNVEELDDLVFKSIYNLRHLFLDFNYIECLNSRILHPLRRLQMLSITNNEIKEISFETFMHNPILDQIFFDHNQITAIDPKFFQEFPGMRDIYEIRFSGNNCTSVVLSNEIDREKNFTKSIEICYENWNSLYKTYDDEAYDISTISEVSSMVYAQNSRYFLDEEHKYTCVLENVDLVLNEINSDHYGSFADENVTRVFFVDSFLSRVPEIIFKKFPNLEFLSVARTQLTIINDLTFGSCGNLKKIDASGNDIVKIVETSLKNCKKLEMIDVSENPIEMVDGEIFHYDPELKHIILRKKIF